MASPASKKKSVEKKPVRFPNSLKPLVSQTMIDNGIVMSITQIIIALIKRVLL